MSDESAHVSGDRVHDGFRARRLRVRFERSPQPIVTVQVVLDVRGFGDAVREDHERVAGGELNEPSPNDACSSSPRTGPP